MHSYELVIKYRMTKEFMIKEQFYLSAMDEISIV